MKFIILLLCLLCILFKAIAEKNAGMILNGVDTISTQQGAGYFDFITGNPCSTWGGPNSPCVGHIGLQFEDAEYLCYINDPGGLVKDMGKKNLDSIKSAPPDSLMSQDVGIGVGGIFLIRPDSLKKCVGNCYIIKTGIDPRPIWKLPLYAKIKILNFFIVDSANYNIKMSFLWVFNRSGPKDLTTSGLDTFHLVTTSSRPHTNQLVGNQFSRFTGGQYVFKVVGGRFVVPEELVNKVKFLEVFDLKGRVLEKIIFDHERICGLPIFEKGKNVVIVKIK
jgi:hypothetical protein